MGAGTFARRIFKFHVIIGKHPLQAYCYKHVFCIDDDEKKDMELSSLIRKLYWVEPEHIGSNLDERNPAVRRELYEAIASKWNAPRFLLSFHRRICCIYSYFRSGYFQDLSREAQMRRRVLLEGGVCAGTERNRPGERRYSPTCHYSNYHSRQSGSSALEHKIHNTLR